jgi:hypothetical protein
MKNDERPAGSKTIVGIAGPKTKERVGMGDSHRSGELGGDLRLISFCAH